MADTLIQTRQIEGKGTVKVFTRTQFYALAWCNHCSKVVEGNSDLTMKAYDEALAKLRSHVDAEHPVEEEA